MAANTVVKTSANTLTQMDDETLNPDVNAATGGRKNIYITLEINGVNVDIGDIVRSLRTITADVSLVTPLVTVATNKDTNARGTYVFEIGPV